MKATEIIFNGIRMWKISYQGMQCSDFIIREEKLFEAYR